MVGVEFYFRSVSNNLIEKKKFLPLLTFNSFVLCRTVFLNRWTWMFKKSYKDFSGTLQRQLLLRLLEVFEITFLDFLTLLCYSKRSTQLIVASVSLRLHHSSTTIFWNVIFIRRRIEERDFESRAFTQKLFFRPPIVSPQCIKLLPLLLSSNIKGLTTCGDRITRWESRNIRESE